MGSVWSIYAFECMPRVVSGSSDGTCKITNIGYLDHHHAKTFQTHLFKLKYDKDRDTYTFIEDFGNEVSADF